MTRIEEFNKKLKDICDSKINPWLDPEQNHKDADDLMMEELQALGYDIDVFRNMKKWYS